MERASGRSTSRVPETTDPWGALVGQEWNARPAKREPPIVSALVWDIFAELRAETARELKPELRMSSSRTA